MSRILVTGASGRLGRRLVPALQTAGHAVIAAVHRDGFVWPAPVETVAIDLTKPETLERLPRDLDVIVHAAAARLEKTQDFAKALELVQANITGTLELLSVAHTRGVKRFIYCSSLSVYALPQPLPIMEDGATYPVVSPDSLYGISKLGGELMCAWALQQRWLPTLALRLGRIYGPEEPREGLLGQWAHEASDGREIVVHGNGERSLDFLYIEDAIEGLLAAIHMDDAVGVMNLSGGVETTWRELAETVADTFSPSTQRSMIRYLPEGNRTRCALDCSRARSVLRWTPQYSLRDGLRRWKESWFQAADSKLNAEFGVRSSE